MEDFNLPIYYIDNKYELDNNLIIDLELLNTNNQNIDIKESNSSLNDKSLYHILFNPKRDFEKKTIELWSKYYTNNKIFLKDTQNFYKNFDNKEKFDFNKIDNVWNNITTINKKDEFAFIDKYNYIEWDKIKFLNENSLFMYFWSLFNITSPIISLAYPILFLIIPFFILKLQKINITLTTYFEVLKMIASRHQLGQLFSITSVSWDKRIYIIISILFFFIQIYYNTKSCIKFTRNINYITNEINILNEYFEHTIDNIDNVYSNIKDYSSYKLFATNMLLHKNIIQVYNEKFKIISNHIYFYKKVKDIGNIMCTFYNIYNKTDFIKSLEYSLNLNGYISNITNITKLIKNKTLNLCKFSKKTCKFKNAYYPVILNPIKNSYDLNKHILLTGPNAAGKTTLLKTTIYNIILSQQIGCGYYDKATITLYNNIHCYINIPDTSGRDSLFQAEARRCKNILNNIVLNNNNKKDRHFCIFDELFSGTNPYEAISSALAYLIYLSKYKNVNLIITTHYIEICKQLLNNNNFVNKFMNINVIDNTFKYTYLLEDGISKIKGGVKVLKDLDYPLEIINNTKNIIDTLNI